MTWPALLFEYNTCVHTGRTGSERFTVTTNFFVVSSNFGHLAYSSVMNTRVECRQSSEPLGKSGLVPLVMTRTVV